MSTDLTPETLAEWREDANLYVADLFNTRPEPTEMVLHKRVLALLDALSAEKDAREEAERKWRLADDTATNALEALAVSGEETRQAEARAEMLEKDANALATLLTKAERDQFRDRLTLHLSRADKAEAQRELSDLRARVADETSALVAIGANLIRASYLDDVERMAAALGSGSLAVKARVDALRALSPTDPTKEDGQPEALQEPPC